MCPIEECISNRAYYTLSQDYIVLPERVQFPDQKLFYGTSLHEMAHSTGHPDRLKRYGHIVKNQNKEYAKEELVAELSSALMGYYLGIETYMREDHISYMKSWLEELRKDSGYLMDILSDVIQVIKYMCEHLKYNPFEEIKKPDVNLTESKTTISGQNALQKLFSIEELMIQD